MRALLAGRVDAEELESRAEELLRAALPKRLENRETVVLAADGFDAGEREPYVRMAAALKRPRHLILLETAREQVSEEDLRRSTSCAGRSTPASSAARAFRPRCASAAAPPRGQADPVPPAAARGLGETREPRLQSFRYPRRAADAPGWRSSIATRRRANALDARTSCASRTAGAARCRR